MTNIDDKQTLYEFSGFDPSTDSLASSKDQRIIIQHVLTGRQVAFKGFITSFTDRFESSWEDDEVYGRMDPISTFKKTSRTIEMGWDVPAASIAEAQRNLAAASELMRFLYPSYKRIGNNRVLDGSPLLRIKFLNWVQSVKGESVDSRLAASQISNGLLVKSNGFSFAPDLEAGSFDPMPQRQKFTEIFELDEEDPGADLYNFVEKNNNYFEAFPKLLRFSANFTVFHEHELGWENDGGQINEGGKNNPFKRFPYWNTRIRGIKENLPQKWSIGAFEDQEPLATSQQDRLTEKETQEILTGMDLSRIG